MNGGDEPDTLSGPIDLMIKGSEGLARGGLASIAFVHVRADFVASGLVA
jgi:hypothetical protein